MRIKRATAGRRSRLAAAGLFLIIAVGAAGCSGSSSSSASSPAGSAGVNAGPAAEPAAGALAGGQNAPADAGSAGSAASAAKLVPSGQQLIYTAQLTVRADSVNAAISRATSIITSAGGYVSAEDANTGQGQPSQASATVTFKIPVAVYRTTMASLTGGGLGTQLSLSQQAQDVTQQVADTNSQVASDEAAIGQLRALLKDAGSVSSLLSVQNQINAEESSLEAMLAQQSALDHETSYATVTLILEGPRAVVKPGTGSSAPPGLVAGLAHGWHAFVLTVSWVLTALGAMAPFLAAVIAVGALGWWARRRVLRRRQRPAADPGA